MIAKIILGIDEKAINCYWTSISSS